MPIEPSRGLALRRTEHGEVGLYFEAAAVIVALVLLGKVLEQRARGQNNGHELELGVGDHECA